MSKERLLKLLVPDDLEQPVRLDHYLTLELTEQFEHLTRSRIQKLIENGDVAVNGKPGKAGGKLKGGEDIAVTVPADVTVQLAAQEIPLKIIYEDNDLIVVDKPAGMITHPGAGVTESTLVNALLFHCGSSLSGISGVLRPGIVHRLDKDTSGLLVVAKNDLAHQSLSEQIKEKSARRQYFALLEGTLAQESGTIDQPIGRHRSDRKKMAIVNDGRAARTHYETIRHWHKFTLIKAKLETGRTHQIRVHMASLAAPIVGDLVYNLKATGTPEARHHLGLSGHALHSAYLSFTHPRTAALLEFETAIPADFQRLIDRLDNGEQLIKQR